MQSKVSQVMFTQFLDRCLKGSNCNVLVHCVHPGIIYTDLYKHIWWARYLGPIFFQVSIGYFVVIRDRSIKNQYNLALLKILTTILYLYTKKVIIAAVSENFHFEKVEPSPHKIYLISFFELL